MGILSLPLSWLFVGIVATICGFAGQVIQINLFLPILSALLVLPIASIFQNLHQFYQKFLADKDKQNTLVFWLLVFVWLSHLIQVFVPETGFDAVWYHLPIAESVVTSNKFVYLTELYQSVNPQLSDAIFMLGYQMLGEMGAKLVAYLFGLSLMITVYQLSNKFLSQGLALLVTLFVSTFQVVAWQSASFYVDVAKAFWELSALYFVFEMFDAGTKVKQAKIAFHSALLFGASLASKTFSILLLPVFIIFWVWGLSDKFSKTQIVFKIFWLAITSISLALPFYLFSLKYTGNVFHSATDHLQDLILANGNTSLYQYLIAKIVSLPASLWQFMVARDYVSPILLPILLVTIFILIKQQAWQKLFQKYSQSKTFLVLVIFSSWQWLVWWQVPPLSIRYALSGFIVLAILTIWLIDQIKLIKVKQGLLLIIFLATITQIIPRLWVNYRSLKFILGYQTKQLYLDQFRDGWIDEPLDKWHNR